MSAFPRGRASADEAAALRGVQCPQHPTARPGVWCSIYTRVCRSRWAAWKRLQTPYSLSFRVARVWFDLIKAGTKTFELRRASPFWVKRLRSYEAAFEAGRPVRAVFVNGGEVHRREITGSRVHETVDAFTTPENRAAIVALVGEGPVIAFMLGKEVA